MLVTLDEKCPSYSTVRSCAATFRTGQLGTEIEECSGRSAQLGIPENADANHSMILETRRISATKNSRDHDDIQRMGRLDYSGDFNNERDLSQMGSQMSQCWSEARLSASFTSHFGPLSAGSSRIFAPSRN
jgi:hypothetical protein